MPNVLQILARYQDLNSEIARHDARLGKIPEDLKAIDRDQQAASVSIAHAKESVGAGQKKKRDAERELQDLEGKVAKYNSQSRDVKTNEQYRAILSEIQNVKTEIGKVEEKILLAMEEIETLERQVREEEKAVAARKPEFDARRAALAAETARLEEERARLVAEREEVVKQIEPSSLEIYNRMATMRGGVAMAQARAERCTVCNVRLRPQVFSDVRKNDQIIQCDSCKRILYYVEEPPAEGAAAAQAAPAGGGIDPAPPGAEGTA